MIIIAVALPGYLITPAGQASYEREGCTRSPSTLGTSWT
jgi:hypothetical protein